MKSFQDYVNGFFHSCRQKEPRRFKTNPHRLFSGLNIQGLSNLSRTNPGRRTGSSRQYGLVGYDVRFRRRDMPVPGQPAGTCGFLQFGTRCLDKIKHRFKMPAWLAKGMAGNHDTGAAMALPPMIEGKFNFGSLLKKPFCQETDPFGRPVDLIMDQIDRIRKTYRNVRRPVNPDFAGGRHKASKLQAIFYLTLNNILSTGGW
jgi:hypothetical protein